MPTSPKLSRCTSVLGVALAGFVLAGITVTAAPAQADSLLLVGMGDSYSTGAGIPPAESPTDLCNRSARAYPLLAADELGFEGRNVACGGAVVADLTATGRRGEAPQVNGLAGADVVALTIGGNDVGGPNGVLDASRSAAAMADFAAAVNALAPHLTDAYLDIQRAAPQASVFVLGYPDIVPQTQEALIACLGSSAQGLSEVDIHHNVTILNQAVDAAAVAAGAVFVATTPAVAGHEMCTDQPYANSPGDRTPASPGGVMHPNELGHLVMATELIAAIGGPDGPPAGPVPPVTGPPAISPTPPPDTNPVLSPQERAAARAVAAILRDRIRGALDRLGAVRGGR